MSGCHHATATSPEKSYSDVERLLIAGDLAAAQSKAQQAGALFARDPKWAARFLVEDAKVRLYQGRSGDVVRLLGADWNAATDSALTAERLIVLSLAHARLDNHEQAKQDFAAAERICDEKGALIPASVRGDLYLDRGNLALEMNQLGEAQRAFQEGLAAARAGGDTYLESRALLNLSRVNLEQEHYEDALERSNAASEAARSVGAKLILEKSLGNSGWTYYGTGDFERALANFREAAEWASALGAFSDQAEWLNNAGLSEYRQAHLKAAQSFFRRSLELAKSIQNDEEAGDADVALASVQLQLKNTQDAARYIQEAEQLAVKRNSTFDQLPPLVLRAQLLIQQSEPAAAQAMLVDVDRRTRDWPSLRWEAQRSLARLADQSGDPKSAGLWFQRAIATYRAQRSSLHSDDTKLPFFANGRELYLDYADYLVSQHKEDAALAVIDQGRAETLAEGLGLAAGPREGAVPAALDARALARRLHATLLFYSLGPQHSYLWAANGQRTGFYQLPAKSEILPLVTSHRQALLAARDLVAEQEATGRALYEKLVLPAQGLIPPGGRVYIVADEGLHGLNFETLLTPGANSHYWIEDVTITNAASLRLLETSRTASSPRLSAMRHASVLVVGNPIYSTGQYAPLPNASDEVNGVAAHFQADARTLLTAAHASPAAYIASKPENFDYIHFVAHAVANEMIPLDSAVVLSSSSTASEDAKLYARQILSRPLHAELVTISACQGSGVRAYAGEGLVGLAWAFLRAGSKNVIGALWDVSDASTPELMAHLYGQLEDGQPPDAALHTAKLAMLHSRGVFRKPIYWGAFQLYAGGGRATRGSSASSLQVAAAGN